MLSPYGLDIVESCLTCKTRTERLFCDLPSAALQTFETVYILQNPNTEDSLMSAAYFLFQRTFTQLEIGQGAAVSWILAVIIVLATVLQFRYSGWVHYEA